MLRQEWFKKRLWIAVGGFLVVAGGVTWWGSARTLNQPSASLYSTGSMLQKKLTGSEPLLFEKHETGPIEQMLSHTEKYAPFHARFAAASISIEKQEKQKALEESLGLEKELAVSNQAGSLLHAHTLVRIAFLYQSLGQEEKEKQAWQTIWELSAPEKRESLSENLALIEDVFYCEGSGLRDYIQHRLEQL
jgi:hypothetical protein